jgi:hypothetical protein
LGLFDPITKIMLVSDKTTADGNRQRRYRVVFGAHVLGINLTFDEVAQIVGIDPEGD